MDKIKSQALPSFKKIKYVIIILIIMLFILIYFLRFTFRVINVTEEQFDSKGPEVYDYASRADNLEHFIILGDSISESDELGIEIRNEIKEFYGEGIWEHYKVYIYLSEENQRFYFYLPGSIFHSEIFGYIDSGSNELYIIHGA